MGAKHYSPRLCRRARPLPSTVLEQCTIFLEEKGYAHALSLLTNSLTAGTETGAPASVPTPQHLALLTTLALHPKLTTGTTDKDRHRAADGAAKYLQLIATTVDIHDSGFRDALRFEENSGGRRSSARSRVRRAHASGSEDEEIETRSIRSSLRSLWSQNKDFWAVLGWALNCSVCHKSRWERWKAWLELTLDVLDADIDAMRANSDGSEDMQSTLIAHYLSTIGDSRNNRRRIMRAVLADGAQKSMAEFGEVWPQETRAPAKKEGDEDRPSKRQKLDLDNNEYGDYFDDQEEDQSQETKKRPSRGSCGRFVKQEHCDDVDTVNDLDEIEQYGGMESIRLRQRVLAVLTRFSCVAPDLFMSCDELFEVFTEFLRPLPLAVYQQFIMPLKPYLHPDYQIAFNEMMIQPLLGLQETRGAITQADFEQRLAPTAAMNTTAIDNAKLSLLIETILRALWKSQQLDGDILRLAMQVQKGITARSGKVQFNGKKLSDKNSRLAEQAEAVMNDSADRMQALLGMLNTK